MSGEATPVPRALQESRACISCGYALHGIARAGPCPECGYPIERSLAATELLRTADPTWVTRMERGMRWLGWAARIVAFAMLGGVILGILIGIIGTAFVRPAGRQAAADAIVGGVMSVIGVVIAGAMLLAFVLHVRGSWSLGTASPGPHSPPPWALLAVRWGGLALILVPAAAVTGAELFEGAFPQAHLVARVLVQATGLFFLFGFHRAFLHLARGTVADRRVSAFCRNGPRDLRVLIVLFAIGWAITAFVKPTGPGLGALRSAGELGAAPLLLGLAYILHVSCGVRLSRAIALERAVASAGNTTAPA